MCVVLQHIVARETLHSAVAFPRPLVLQGVDPIAPTKRIAFFSLAGPGDLLLHLHRTMHKRLAV